AAESAAILCPAALRTRASASAGDPHQTRAVAECQVGLRRLDEVRSRFDILTRGGVLRKEKRAASARHDVEHGDVGGSSELHGQMLRNAFSLHGRDAWRE